MRILVVDDHEVVGYGLAASLSAVPSARVVAVASTGADAISIARRARPDVAIVDMRLPDMSGVEVCRRLIADTPGMSVVMLTSYCTHETVRSAQDAGAAAYITKSAGIAKLKETVTRIGSGPGGRLSDHSVSAIMHDLDNDGAAESPHSVTRHQQRVLELAAAGLTNGQIGDRLCISESTVRFHIQKLKRVFDVPTRTALIVRAVQDHVVSPDAEPLLAIFA
jgi:DNA-binding NarL/FixJ family response regulator